VSSEDNFCQRDKHMIEFVPNGKILATLSADGENKLNLGEASKNDGKVSKEANYEICFFHLESGKQVSRNVLLNLQHSPANV
jgi:hypothetical protein